MSSSINGRVLTRLAPSPTGHLHVGNARRALDNWLFARRLGGQFMLRMDDTDQERSKIEYEESIQEDLKWLGLEWDIFARQSDRMDRYALAAEALKKSGRLYPCYETSEELDFKRKRQLSRGLPPIYDRGALSLPDEQKQAHENEGRKPHWRFLLTPEAVSWNDLHHGTLTFEGAKLSDPVLLRTDGMPVYTLASVVDDVELGVTHIIRGDDHITNTAIQIQLMQALGADVSSIYFGHLPLLTDAVGEGLSKRLGSLSIRSLREEGIDPMAVNSLLARLGSSDPIEPFSSLEPLIQTFDMQKFSKGTPKFSIEELRDLNAKILRHMPYEEALPRLEHAGVNDVAPELWSIVQGNLNTLNDIQTWQSVIKTPPTLHSFPEEDCAFVVQSLEYVPEGPFTPDTWKTWTEALKVATGRKGRQLFMPLRLALTGYVHGPEMKDFLPLIGRDSTLERLKIIKGLANVAHT